MNHEFLRMQKLSGVITEGEYNQKIEELNSTESSTETLNENVVGIGSVLNPYPTKAKEVYESAFNEFLTEEKEEMEEAKEEMEEAHCYEEPVGEAKEDLEEDKRTDAEEEGYQDGFKDAIKDALDAIKGLKKELKEEDMDEAIEPMGKKNQRHKGDYGSDRGAERKSLDSEPRYNKKDTE